MTKKAIRKTVIISLSTLAFLFIVLCVHIYIVTRPKPIDQYSRVMARIDINQQISQADADKIQTWLYEEKGVDHVLVNAKTKIVVFTFFPIKTSGDKIVSDFKAALPYKNATRYVPTEAEMQSGCPMSSPSTDKLTAFIKSII